ncbi:hypothetical protein CH373_14395 [Leptospira perolatii]|uniref:Uncharacterized protein n=1 Tax=Leptospira perolatii TaxID=2023191 RepID=A0A2M9ZJV8_9LEPT|nr:hypothetical protein [Leptospira perolatii]PJZ69273.1 hypothetical protein CH360_12225 [Leptospira perolatii]PJZ72345.1 hypothetical protein CH373_14395 [Leptospira perolatii]
MKPGKIRTILVICSFAILSTLTYSGCKKPKTERQLQIEETHKVYQERIKDSYEISEASESREEAVASFLKSVASGKPDHYIFTKEEYLNIFLPNTLNEGTLTANMTEEEAWEITAVRRAAALDHIKSTLKGIKPNQIKVETIRWKKPIRKLNALDGYPIGVVEIRVGKEVRTIEEIRLVVGHKGKYKVCVIST